MVHGHAHAHGLSALTLTDVLPARTSPRPELKGIKTSDAISISSDSSNVQSDPAAVDSDSSESTRSSETLGSLESESCYQSSFSCTDVDELSDAAVTEDEESHSEEDTGSASEEDHAPTPK